MYIVSESMVRRTRRSWAGDSAAVRWREHGTQPASSGPPSFQKGRVYSASLSAALAHAANWGGIGQRVGQAVGVVTYIYR
jgi:hypothetical protein